MSFSVMIWETSNAVSFFRLCFLLVLPSSMQSDNWSSPSLRAAEVFLALLAAIVRGSFELQSSGCLVICAYSLSCFVKYLHALW